MASSSTDSPTTRDKILAASGDLFSERGYLGASTRDIADRVGIRQPSLFHHFQTKAAIMAELQRLDFVPTIELIERLVQSSAPSAVRLYHYLSADVRRILTFPFETRASTSRAVLNDPALSEGRRLYDQLQGLQTKLIAAGVEDNSYVAVDPQFASRTIEWMVEGVLVDAHRQQGLDAATFADELASFALRSLLREPLDLDGIRQQANQLFDDQ